MRYFSRICLLSLLLVFSIHGIHGKKVQDTITRTTPLKTVWKAPFPKKKILHVFSTWDRLYAQLENYDIFCLDKRNGIVKWICRLKTETKATPAENSRGLYFYSENEIIHVDKRTGKILWKKYFSFPVSAPPTVTEFSIYVPQWGEKMHSFDVLSRERKWFYNFEGECAAIPLAMERALYIPADSGHLYCLADTGKLNWIFTNKDEYEELGYLSKSIDLLLSRLEKENSKGENRNYKIIMDLRKQIRETGKEMDEVKKMTKGKYISSPVTYGPYLYICSTDYNTYKLDASSGKPIWQYETGSPIYTAPIAYKDILLTFPENQGTVAIDTQSGKLKWQLKNAKTILAADRKHFYIIIEDGNRDLYLCSFNRENAQTTWKYKLESGDYTFIPDYTSNSLYMVFPNDGLIWALNTENKIPQLVDPFFIPKFNRKPRK